MKIKITLIIVFFIFVFYLGGCNHLANYITPDCEANWRNTPCGNIEAYLNRGAKLCRPYLERLFKTGGRCNYQ